MQYTMNGIGPVQDPLPTTTYKIYYVTQITSHGFLNAIQLGVNYFTLALPVATNQVQLNHIAIFIEYEYQA